jgi:hypothetical protein
MKNVAYLHTARADVFNEFEELRPLIQDKLLDVVYERAYKKIPTPRRKKEIRKDLIVSLPEDKKHLLVELESFKIRLSG